MDAIAHFKQAASLAPDWPMPYVGLGMASISAKRLGDSATLSRSVLHVHPNHIDALCGIGSLHAQRGQWAESQRCFSIALRQRFNSPEIHYGLGNALAGSDRPQLAADHYSQAVRLRPSYTQAWNNLGIIARGWETYRAITCFQNVLSRNPASPQAQHNLSKALQARQAAAAKSQATLIGQIRQQCTPPQEKRANQ